MRRTFVASLGCVLLAAGVATGCSGAGSSPVTWQPVHGARSQASRFADQVRVQPRDLPLSKSETIIPASGGGTIGVLPFGGFSGRFVYAPNDARSAKVTLTMTNSGLNNVLNAPTPSPSQHPAIQSNGPILFLEAQVGGTKALTFQDGSYNASLRSKLFVPNAPYTMYLYFGKTAAGSYALGTASSDQRLSFASPLAGISIPRKTALVMEVVGARL